MFFSDYSKTGFIYHIAPINDLKRILTEGIQYDDKQSYKSKYIDFHSFIDQEKTPTIPNWVIRRKSIFASLNYRDNPRFHSHSVVLAVRIQPEKCWVANENLANEIYEPFILQDIEAFKESKEYMKTRGRGLAQEYWETSLSFLENTQRRFDLKKGYDAEVLVHHTIYPKDIKPLFIVSDHHIYTIKEWKRTFCSTSETISN
ncbi:hypothetical protein [Alkaliphilus peptidifermentans]|uniref:DarT domain-containing protein n=1 Tax=Alkaliphilus peptidifermentans DSM 18978 TaxID=1120976 RepID=A0A1G5L3P6_9FIRM|nr:hypothetical protein [Alkaliphilus peptidifermentans]SCZ06910.1 hypothetical protein SAMN03080606_03990 [Alkaliphilus peptidifermentans DSM 18978]